MEMVLEDRERVDVLKVVDLVLDVEDMDVVALELVVEDMEFSKVIEGEIFELDVDSKELVNLVEVVALELVVEDMELTNVVELVAFEFIVEYLSELVVEMAGDLDVVDSIVEEVLNVTESVDELIEFETLVVPVVEVPELGEAVALDVDVKELIELSL